MFNKGTFKNAGRTLASCGTNPMFVARVALEFSGLALGMWSQNYIAEKQHYYNETHILERGTGMTWEITRPMTNTEKSHVLHMMKTEKINMGEALRRKGLLKDETN